MQRATQLKDSSGISIGIEFGSTRIKTVAIDEQFNTLASGYYEWENQFTNGYWTYSVNDIWIGIQKSYKDMATTFQTQYGLTLKTINSIGISGMMHGYLAFNEYEDLLVPFRTWRNSYTTEAAQKLREVFKYNIPERWSVAHLYQAILNKEAHVSSVNYITTLSGYIHWYLTGEKVLGIGDASGMFPVDVQNQSYRKDLLAKADQLLQAHGFNQSMCDILPSIKSDGEVAGYITK